MYDATNQTFSSINVQTTPGPSTTSSTSAIAGGNYAAVIPPNAPVPGVPTTPPAIVFISGVIGQANTRRVALLAPNTLTDAGGTVQVSQGSTEGFCNATCASVVAGSASRSITGGSLVAVGGSAPVRWYLNGTFSDGGQVVGQRGQAA